jgi:hypothetical protein
LHNFPDMKFYWHISHSSIYQDRWSFTLFFDPLVHGEIPTLSLLAMLLWHIFLIPSFAQLFTTLFHIAYSWQKKHVNSNVKERSLLFKSLIVKFKFFFS